MEKKKILPRPKTEHPADIATYCSKIRVAVTNTRFIKNNKKIKKMFSVLRQSSATAKEKPKNGTKRKSRGSFARVRFMNF